MTTNQPLCDFSDVPSELCSQLDGVRLTVTTNQPMCDFSDVPSELCSQLDVRLQSIRHLVPCLDLLQRLLVLG